MASTGDANMKTIAMVVAVSLGVSVAYAQQAQQGSAVQKGTSTPTQVAQTTFPSTLPPAPPGAVLPPPPPPAVLIGLGVGVAGVAAAGGIASTSNH
jgi:hypothetical protein